MRSFARLRQSRRPILIMDCLLDRYARAWNDALISKIQTHLSQEN